MASFFLWSQFFLIDIPLKEEMAMKRITLFVLLSIMGCDEEQQVGTQVPVSPRSEQRETEQRPVDGEGKTAEDTNPTVSTTREPSNNVDVDSGVTDVVLDTVNNSAIKLTAADCVDPDLNEVKAGVQLMLCDGTLATGTLALPDLTNLIAGNIRAGVMINDVSGTLVEENHGACSGNNQTGCVTNATYRSADLSNLLAQNIKSGVTIAGVSGSVVEEGHSNCSANAQTGCIATASFKAADLTNLQASNVKATVTIAGVAGSLVVESHSDCSANGETGCVATTTYKAADISNLSAGNLKSGVSIAGVTGNYPSASSPLSGATATADLDLATFNAKIKSASDFEWFDANGNRYVNAGDADLTAANLVKDVSIFGTVGTTEALGTVDPWNIRKGVAVGSVTGMLNTNCRDISEGGPAADKCYGDSFVDASVPGFNCSAGAKYNCIFKDRISGLRWSKQFDAQTYANATNTCSTLNINGVTGWRLPEFTELVVARNNGFTHAFSPSNILLVGTYTGGNLTSSGGTAANTQWAIFMQHTQAYRTGLAADANVYPFFCVK